MPLTYTDDVDITDRSDRKVALAFSKFAEQDKVPFTNSLGFSIAESVEIDGYNFQVVKNFVYLG